MGSWVCELKTIVQAESSVKGKLVAKHHEGEDDESHLQFDVVRILRDACDPKELFQAFFAADTDGSRCVCVCFGWERR